MSNPNSDRNFRAFFGRRLGRPLNSSRAQVLDDLLPVLQVSEKQISQNADLAPSSLFDGAVKHVTLEIGFGSGEHLVGLLNQNLDRHYIGAEPYINGMSAFLKDIEEDADVQNRVRVYMNDALELVRSLEVSSLDRLYILNPDPWHKKKHHKRRIVRPETLDEYARVLKSGAQLIMSSDAPYMSEWMFAYTFNHGAFEWDAECADDWRHEPDGWIRTKYATKGAKGADQMSYLIFTRI